MFLSCFLFIFLIKLTTILNLCNLELKGTMMWKITQEGCFCGFFVIYFRNLCEGTQEINKVSEEPVSSLGQKAGAFRSEARVPGTAPWCSDLVDKDQCFRNTWCRKTAIRLENRVRSHIQICDCCTALGNKLPYYWRTTVVHPNRQLWRLGHLLNKNVPGRCWKIRQQSL